MAEKDLVISPVYNEERTLERFYARLSSSYDGDILFIDDGSTDRSGSILDGLRCRKVFLNRHIQRMGYGAALKAGFDFALRSGYKKIVTLDADLQHDPREIGSFLAGLEDAELVLGSRYITIEKVLDVPRDRLIINRYIAQLFKQLFPVEFTDPFCGYRAYTNTFLEKIRLREPGYGLALEILLESVRTSTAFKEVPLEAVYLDEMRVFLDGLNEPRARLRYYLGIISRKKIEMENEEKILSYKSSS